MATASEINQVKTEAKLMILNNRSTESSRIEHLRSRSRKYLRNKKHSIETIRIEMAEEMKSAEHIGNTGLCTPANDKAVRETYCTTHYIDDYEILSACRDFSTFCYMCCDNEFGDLIVDEKTACFAMCDNEYKTLADEP